MDFYEKKNLHFPSYLVTTIYYYLTAIMGMARSRGLSKCFRRPRAGCEPQEAALEQDTLFRETLGRDWGLSLIHI